MTRLNQNVAVSPESAAGHRGWAPRLAQESRLRQLEDVLARQPMEADAIGTEIERAVLLGALDRRQDAQQAFIDILRRAPTHFSALNEFGTLLTNMGAIDAACRVYSEAILHHPDNPMAHVNLANLLLLHGILDLQGSSNLLKRRLRRPYLESGKASSGH